MQLKKHKILISAIAILVFIATILISIRLTKQAILFQGKNSDFSCGENAYYSYDSSNHIVTITGTGTIDLTKGYHYMYDTIDRGYSEHDYDAVGELRFPDETEKIIICEGITGIKNSCGANCRDIKGGATYEHLKEIVLPNSLTDLGTGCFANQTSLEKINIPNSIKIISSYAFYNCDKLYYISFPKSVRIIESNAFEKCATLPEVKLQNVRYIGERAFQNCYNLKSIEIDGDIPDLLAYTFDGCFNLQNVKLTDNIKVIEHSAFRNCKYIDRNKIYANVESPHAYKWSEQEKRKDLEEAKEEVNNEPD